MKATLRVLLEGLVDYAGLYPPAALPFDEAVRRYRSYREGDHAWMLGRFIVPFERRAEVPSGLPLSVVARHSLPDGADQTEIKAATAEDVARIAAATKGRLVYVEVDDIDLLEPIAIHGLRAKLRTGGVTHEAFPSADRIATFLRGCAMAGVPFKATAGLHHPIRCVKPLTYEPDAPVGTMHGFINLFMAAVFAHEAEHVLVEEDPSAFRFDDDIASWRDHSVALDHIRRVRSEFAISFGSCSFEEPVQDLRDLGWM